MLDHLWLHFARHGPDITPPVITRGEGVTIFDDRGKSYLDGLSGLFTVQVGHGRAELAQAAARQAETLAFFPLWGYATPTAIELSDRLANYAPGDLNRVFFTSGGTEAVETAWKVAKQYFKLIGKPGKHKVISRAVAYHGTTQGALAITGLPKYKAPFEPVTPGGFRVPNTNFYRAPEPVDTDIKAFGQWAADRIAEAIEFEGPDTVAAVFLEPVQNAGGSIPPPPGYFERVREICDYYDVLLVSDEVICAFGRIGSMFACCRLRLRARHDHLRQGFDVGILAPWRDDRQREAVRAVQRRRDDVSARLHLRRPSGVHSGRAGQPRHLRARRSQRPRQTQSPALRATLEKLYDLPIVGDVRGEGYFFGIELVKDKATKQTFDADEKRAILLAGSPSGCSKAGCTAAPTIAAIPSSSSHRR